MPQAGLRSTMLDVVRSSAFDMEGECSHEMLMFGVMAVFRFVGSYDDILIVCFFSWKITFSLDHAIKNRGFIYHREMKIGKWYE